MKAPYAVSPQPQSERIEKNQSRTHTASIYVHMHTHMVNFKSISFLLFCVAIDFFLFFWCQARLVRHFHQKQMTTKKRYTHTYTHIEWVISEYKRTLTLAQL